MITNPNKIADMVEKISPIHKGKCPPVIENSDAMLREICYSKAHEIYGENLPEMVEALSLIHILNFGEINCISP